MVEIQGCVSSSINWQIVYLSITGGSHGFPCCYVIFIFQAHFTLLSTVKKPLAITTWGLAVLLEAC